MSNEHLQRTLFIQGRSLEASAHIPLFVYNDVTMEHGSITLYIKADGVWEGRVPYSESRTLFLEQWGEGKETTLFTHGNRQVNTYATLYTINFEMSDGNITLVIPNVYGTVNTYAPMYVHGVYEVNGALLLCIPNVMGYKDNECPLYVFGW